MNEVEEERFAVGVLKNDGGWRFWRVFLPEISPKGLGREGGLVTVKKAQAEAAEMQQETEKREGG